MHELLWTEPAIRDLEDIGEHLNDAGAVDAAVDVAQRILERVEALTTHPRSGRRVPELARSGYRELIVAPYRIVYAIDDDELRIIILRVWHGRRDLIGMGGAESL